MKKKILYIINEGYFFLSHKKNLAFAMKDQGYEIHVAVPSNHVWAPLKFSNSEITDRGFICHEYNLSRRGQNIFLEFFSFIQLFYIIFRLKPSIIHLMTIKPIIYGGLISKLFPKTQTVLSVTGLGQAFTEHSLFAKIRRLFIQKLLKTILKSSLSSLIVQNSDDFQKIKARKLVEETRISLIKGSGISSNEFPFKKEPKNDVPIVILASRLLYEKGVREFYEAAKILYEKKYNVRFILVGDTQKSNPRSVPLDLIKSWVDTGVIEWWGRREDMFSVISSSNIVCLPSRYGEGVPKVILEAASVGRPLVVSDNPGCMELVTHKETGLIAKNSEPNQIATCVIQLLENKGLREKIILNAMKKIKSEFSSNMVVNQTLKIYKKRDDEIRLTSGF